MTKTRSSEINWFPRTQRENFQNCKSLNIWMRVRFCRYDSLITQGVVVSRTTVSFEKAFQAKDLLWSDGRGSNVFRISFIMRRYTVTKAGWSMVITSLIDPKKIYIICARYTSNFYIWGGVVWIEIKGAKIYSFVLAMKRWFLYLLGFNMIVWNQIMQKK